MFGRFIILADDEGMEKVLLHGSRAFSVQSHGLLLWSVNHPKVASSGLCCSTDSMIFFLNKTEKVMIVTFFSEAGGFCCLAFNLSAELLCLV